MKGGVHHTEGIRPFVRQSVSQSICQSVSLSVRGGKDGECAATETCLRVGSDGRGGCDDFAERHAVHGGGLAGIVESKDEKLGLWKAKEASVETGESEAHDVKSAGWGTLACSVLGVWPFPFVRSVRS